MKNIIQKSSLFFFILFLTNYCGNSVLNPPNPKAPINLLVGFLIAEAIIAPYESLQYSSCEGAEEVKIGDKKTASIGSNSMKFFKLTNTSATDYVDAYYSVTSGSSSSGGSSTTCLFVGKEDQLINTNSSNSTLDYPTTSNCGKSYSFEITKDKFRCIGVASLSNISISLQITQTTSSAPASVSSISPLSGPVGTLVTITGKNLGSNSSTSTTRSVYFGSSTSSAMVESSSYAELKVRVPRDATSGSIKIGSTSATSVGTFTLTTVAMMTRSTPGCTFTSINGNGGTTISQSSFTYPSGLTYVTDLGKGSTKIPIGFTFSYFGVPFDNIYLNTNGGASFLTDSYSSFPFFISTTETFLLAPWWGDLNLDGSSSVQYSVTGVSGSRVFSAEWVNYPDWYNTAFYRLNFQIKLYEGTNIVDFVYGSKAFISGPGGNANIGIKNGIGGTGNFIDGVSGSTSISTTYGAASQFPTLNTCYRFTP